MATSLAPAGENVRANGSGKKLQRGGSRRSQADSDKADGPKGLEAEFFKSFAGNTVSEDTFLVGILTGSQHCRVPREIPLTSREYYFAAIRRRLQEHYKLNRLQIGMLTATYRGSTAGPGRVNTMLSRGEFSMPS